MHIIFQTTVEMFWLFSVGEASHWFWSNYESLLTSHQKVSYEYYFKHISFLSLLTLKGENNCNIICQNIILHPLLEMHVGFSWKMEIMGDLPFLIGYVLFARSVINFLQKEWANQSEIQWADMNFMKAINWSQYYKCIWRTYKLLD